MTSSNRHFDDLREQVLTTLETNGVLGQIRAELRANVYRVIDAEEDASGGASRIGPATGPSTSGAGAGATASPSRLLRSPAAQLMAEVVAEFLEFYDFKHSLSVLVPEANMPRARRNRSEVALDAGLGRVRAEVSILEQILDQATAASAGGAGPVTTAAMPTVAPHGARKGLGTASPSSSAGATAAPSPRGGPGSGSASAGGSVGGGGSPSGDGGVGGSFVNL